MNKFGWMAAPALALMLVACGGGEPASTAPPAMIGDTVSLDGASVIVEGVELRDQVGGEYTREKASQGAVLVVVRYALTNTGTKPLSAFAAPTLKLVDAAGTEYGSDVGKSSAYAMESDLDIKAFSDLNPGITVRGAEVFEVGKAAYDSATWNLKIGNRQVRLLGAMPKN